MTDPRVLFVSGSAAGNTLRYRVRYAEEYLRSTGVCTAAVHVSDPQLRSWARQADAVVLYRTPASRRLLDAVEHLRTERRIPIAFDIDDRVFLPGHLDDLPFLDQLEDSDRERFCSDVVRRGLVVPFVDATTGSTTPILEELAALTDAPATVLPNGVPPTALRYADAARSRMPDGTVRVGYFSGSSTHDDDWAVAEPAVLDLLARDRRVELWLVGPVQPSPALSRFPEQVRIVKAVSWQELPMLLAAVDINLAPLDVTPFTEGKSAIKWLEAALVRTPTIATATRPFLDATVEGQDVLLVPTGGDWSAALAQLVDDTDRRIELGDAARAAALTRFGPQQQSDRYRRWLDGLLAGGPRDADLDELRRVRSTLPSTRAFGAPLQEYRFPNDLPPRDLAAPRLVRVTARGRRAARTTALRAIRIGRGVRRRFRRLRG